ncbi:MAG: hypothetical protein R3F59_22925 [Myxococcota bacterium]
MDLLSLPDPDTLTDARQRWVTERFAVVTLCVTLVAASYANLFGSVLLAVRWSLAFSTVVTAMVVGMALPTAGMLGIVVWHRRRARAVHRAVREQLAIPRRRNVLAWGAAAGIVAAVAAQFAGPTNLGFAVLLLGLGVAGAWWRRRQDRTFPAWAIAASLAWTSVGCTALVALTVWVEPTTALMVGSLWIAAPALLVAPFRGRIAAWAREPGVRGRWARRAAVFLPAQSIGVVREQGDAAKAVALARERLGPALLPRILAEVLVELGLGLLALDDAQAVPVLAAATRIRPDDPKPFVALARALAASDPARARVYLAFAEASDARKLLGADPAIAALRAELGA